MAKNGETNGRRFRSCLDAAAYLLQQRAGQSMTCPQMIKEMAEKGLWKTTAGKTSAATLEKAIIREIKAKKHRSRFVKRGRGQYAAALREYEFSPEVTKGWRSHPIRLRGPSDSRCCGCPTLLFQVMDGGFVAACCSARGCRQSQRLKDAEFFDLGRGLWVSCPDCSERMDSNMVPSEKYGSNNYGFTCHKCGVYVWLAKLLPRWQDLV